MGLLVICLPESQQRNTPRRRREGAVTRVGVVFMALALAALPRAAFAQPTPRFDLAASDGFINAVGYGNDYHEGWVLSCAYYPRNWWGLAAELGAGYSGFDVPAGPPLRARFYNFMAGPRVVLRSLPHVRPFTQVIFGGVRFGNNYGGYVSRFAWQTGGGLDIPIARKLSVRLQTDWRTIPLPPPPHDAKFKQLRLAVGIAFN